MSFSRISDIQSWWEVPSIAYFCSLFRTAFNLLDFDIEELEEALLTDGTEETASSLLTELIVRLLNGSYGSNDISAFNYQMYLRRLFRQKCQETGRYNPFNTDIDFQFLPLRTKVEILYALCDFRLDSEDVFQLFRNLDSDSLRVEPLGWDNNDSAYWYFYGTRLYREDVIRKPKSRSRRRRGRRGRKRGWFYGDDWLDDDVSVRVWQVVCFTENDWNHLTDKFRRATSKVEKELYLSLSQNFLPEIPRLFDEKDRLQRKSCRPRRRRRGNKKVLLEHAPRRTSSRVLQKNQEKERETKRSAHEARDNETKKQAAQLARDTRARRRERLRTKSASSDSSDSSSETEEKEMPQKVSKSKKTEKQSKPSTTKRNGSPPPAPPVKTGRKTNNSLACATGQIVIPDNVEPVNSTRRKLKTSQIFTQTDEDVQIDMYKVLDQLSAHDDAWPFMDPVEEDYAPNYYSVIRRPMDLRKMEERLDSGYYTDFNMFKADFKLIVNNCRLYNGQDNEYTTMVDNLQAAFDRLTEKYIHQVSSSDEEIAVEYQLPTPSRKHKIKTSESPIEHKRKKMISQSEQAEPKSSCSNQVELEEENEEEELPEPNEEEEPKESHKSKKKRKGHHKHEKHSKNHKKHSQESEHESRSSHSKKHGKNKDRDGKKRKKSKHQEVETEEIKRSESRESVESSSRSRSASPLPPIHTPTPSPSPSPSPSPACASTSASATAPAPSSAPSSATSPAPSPAHSPAPSAAPSRSPSPSPSRSPTEQGHSSRGRQREQRNIRHKPRRQPELQQADQLADPDFCKNKYDKIKERRRHAAKNVWQSLFDFKQNTLDTQKQNLHIPEKDKNQKLRETIEKLKAKNAKYKTISLFSRLFGCDNNRRRSSDSHAKDPAQDDDDDSDSSDNESLKEKITQKKRGKKTTARNESATVALEQAVKDISKWLDDTPKGSGVSCSSDSPTQTISTEDAENSRQDDESSQGDKSLQNKKEFTRKRPSSREPKLVKRQRTIERLQPGKSKGNLLTNISNKTSEKVEESDPADPLNKIRETVKGDESSPKLSLGSVLPSVEFTLGSDHNFANKEDKIAKKIETITSAQIEQPIVEENKVVYNEDKSTPTKKDAEVETEPTIPPKPNQEKATPNLSAWFKAFGAPKAATSTITSKKKNEHEPDEKTTEKMNLINKLTGMKLVTRFDYPNGPETNDGGGESPLPHACTTPRQRRISTGSSISERSSFSQDLDSPRHQMTLTSPLLRSPASPRYDDFQKISYPIINGTVRAGFYQDTTSVKSSPEKSGSPREMPQSPYSPYSQHVYISNTATGSATPNYFVDHNKSPLPAYGQNAPSYYEASKSTLVNKPARSHDDYSTLGTEPYQPNAYKEPYASTSSPYPQVPTKDYSHPSVSTHPVPVMTNPVSCTSAPINADPKTTQFPVKKRTYNEPEELTKKSVEPKDMSAMTKSYDHHKMYQIPTSNTSVDDIALALTEKSENLSKNLCMREKSTMEYVERHSTKTTEIDYDSDVQEVQTDDVIPESSMSIGVMKKDGVDMINMGYMNTEKDRRSSSEMREMDFAKPDAAMNLGINNHLTQIALAKSSVPTSNMTPAHCHDRQISDIPINHNVAHMHHKQYDANNFSLSDIELANKKLYAGNASMQPSSTAIDYGNWKMTNQIRKADIMPSDYSNSYSAHQDDKLKPEINLTNTAALNYNKNLQQEQYNAYNSVPRASLQRPQNLHQNLQCDIRVPNPRAMMIPPAHCDNESISKNIDTLAKSQKTDKLVQNHPLAYKTSYSTLSSNPLESLRSISSMPQMLDRYSNEERYLSSYSGTGAPLYHDPITTSVSSVYSQHSPSVSKVDMYKPTSTITSAHQDLKPKPKRKRTMDNKPSPVVAQTYHSPTCSTSMLKPVKSNMMPTSAFNFGSTPTLGAPLYGENGGFSIEDLRNSTNQLMAVNYMAAAVAHQQRNTTETSADKHVKPAHQNTTHTSGSFPYIGHGQVRAGYPFVGAEASQPLYQQYLQRHQEELLRHTGAQIMSLYSPAYPAALGVRAPHYDGINRHSWL